MKTITIDGKDYKVVDAVVEEISWLNHKLKAAKEIIKQIENLDDEFDTQRYKYEGEKQKLINEINNL
jgi:hypothetical protein